MPIQAVPTQTTGPEPLARLKELALRRDPEFLGLLREQTIATASCEDMLLLSALRKRAAQKGLLPEPQKDVRVAVLGGYTPFPLHELIGHFLAAAQPVSWKSDFLLG